MKKLMTFFLLAAIVVTQLAHFTARANFTPEFEVQSEAAILVSLDTDEVLFAKNAEERRYPASLTKIMTAVVVLEHSENLDARLTVRQSQIDPFVGTTLITGELRAGESLSVRVLLNMMMVSSAADATLVLSDYIEQTTDMSFIDLMNAKAYELGMHDTNFTNAVGYHHENHYSTINDLVLLCKYAIALPNFLDMSSQVTFRVPATNMQSARNVHTTNLMLNRGTAMYYRYARGIRTGFTSQAGRCVAVTAFRNGYSYLAIVMGGDDARRTEFSDASNLFRWAFLGFEYRTVAEANTMIGEMEVRLSGETDFIQLFPERNVGAILPSNIDNSSLIYEMVLTENSVNAPIASGQIMGYVRIIAARQEIARVNLIAREPIRRSLLMFIGELFRIIVSSTWFGIIGIAVLVILTLLIISNIAYNRRKRQTVKRVRKIRKL